MDNPVAVYRAIRRMLGTASVERLALILAHNHPSGSLQPSRDDVEFTRCIGRAGLLMGIELLDHLIVSRRGYTSLKERGLM